MYNYFDTPLQSPPNSSQGHRNMYWAQCPRPKPQGLVDLVKTEYGTLILDP